ncbi:MAG: hypothetical protein KDJ83_00995 [Rhodobacteraceae bacterium]|nr:hypothetical protein [Paracoccaceae bacterium]
MDGFFGFSHPFYRPLWRRLLVVGAALGWALVEAVSGHPGWALLFGAAGAWAAWGLLIAYPPGRRDPDTSDTSDTSDTEDPE